MPVIVYSTHTCPYCTMAKDFLKQSKIQFENVFVDEDSEKADEMIQKSGQTGVPVLDINGKIIVGFNQPAIKKALNLK